MSDENLKLKIRSLRKTYGTVVALESADIDLREGEFLTLLGPSGSGKSTLLWAVAGLNDPDSGQIWIDGREATHLPPFQREIGMVFQNYALFPHMTIGQNIGFPLEMRKMNRIDREKAVMRVLDMVKLGHVADRFPIELSGGQQQRIALARAFVYEPSIILMEEPLGALDKKLRDHLQLEIKHLHEQLGVTIMYVTHDQEEAMVMSDRICLMNNAGIEQIGTPEELYFRPKTVFAADFLGESNLVDGIVREVNGSSTSVEIGGTGITRALPNPDLNVGEKVKLMTRPEAVDVLSNGETRSNEVSGTLREIIVGGGATKLFVELPGGDTMRVTQLTRGAAERLTPVLSFGLAGNNTPLFFSNTPSWRARYERGNNRRLAPAFSLVPVHKTLRADSTGLCVSWVVLCSASLDAAWAEFSQFQRCSDHGALPAPLGQASLSESSGNHTENRRLDHGFMYSRRVSDCLSVGHSC